MIGGSHLLITESHGESAGRGAGYRGLTSGKTLVIPGCHSRILS